MKSPDSQVTAFPAAVAAGVIAMALAEGLGRAVYPPVAFLACFALTMVVFLVSFLRDAQRAGAEDSPEIGMELHPDLRARS